MHRAVVLLAIVCTAAVSSCAEPEPPGPTSDTSVMPWNVPQPGEGGGQLNMLPQNQYRR